MQWDESLATGCSVIDKQHKELLKQVNKAIKAYQEGKAKKEVETTLQFLEEYVHTHFRWKSNYKYNINIQITKNIKRCMNILLKNL